MAGVCRLLLLVFLLTLAAPAVAGAEITVPDALRIAYQADPQAPCAGHVNVTWLAMPDFAGQVGEQFLGAGKGMRATDATDTAHVLLSCDIALNPALNTEPDGGVHRCDVVVHEVKHLAGHEHAEGGVMTPTTGQWGACHLPQVGRLKSYCKAVYHCVKTLHATINRQRDLSRRVVIRRLRDHAWPVRQARA